MKVDSEAEQSNGGEIPFTSPAMTASEDSQSATECEETAHARSPTCSVCFQDYNI